MKLSFVIARRKTKQNGNDKHLWLDKMRDITSHWASVFKS